MVTPLAIVHLVYCGRRFNGHRTALEEKWDWPIFPVKRGLEKGGEKKDKRGVDTTTFPPLFTLAAKRFFSFDGQQQKQTHKSLFPSCLPPHSEHTFGRGKGLSLFGHLPPLFPFLDPLTSHYWRKGERVSQRNYENDLLGAAQQEQEEGKEKLEAI